MLSETISNDFALSGWEFEDFFSITEYTHLVEIFVSLFSFSTTCGEVLFIASFQEDGTELIKPK